MSLLVEAVIFLAAAVVAVPIFKRLGLGAVLGYLVAGAVIGPWGLGVIAGVDDILHLSEFGVVLLLFIIGLELQPIRLWTMRRAVFGLGGAQVLLTAAALGGVAYVFGLGVNAAIVVGLTLSFSSTAFALQVLAERNELTTRFGRLAFAILLFQDLAVIPLLALVPLLGGVNSGPLRGAGWIDGLAVVLTLGIVVAGGRYVLRHLFRMVATSGIQEVFTAAALLTVTGMALLMTVLGLSMALGAFLAGVLLADSEYRHAVKADIDPFKGVFLGLFFMAVGMSLNLGLLVAQPLTVAAAVAGLMAAKFALLFVLGRVQGLDNRGAVDLATAISQSGEFGFVMLGVAVGAGVIGQGLSELLIVVVTLSMGVTPILFAGIDALRRRGKAPVRGDFDVPPADAERHVIVAGFGRFGSTIARVLAAKKIPFTALEINTDQIDFMRKYGATVYYGDASRLDLLKVAGAERAAAFVLAVGNVEESLRIAATVREHFPSLTIYARAYNRRHAYLLMDLGVTVIGRDTFLSSLDLACTVLRGLGMSDAEADRMFDTFRQHDEVQLFATFWHHSDEEKMALLAKESARELEELFALDAAREDDTKSEAAE